MPYTLVPTRAGGYAPLESDWDTYIRDNLNSGWAKIAETNPNGSTAALTVSSIPSTFRHLRVVWYARTREAGTALSSISVRLNGDATAGNYDRQFIQGSGATMSAAEILGLNQIVQIPGLNAPSGLYGIGYMEIPHYSQATNQKAMNIFYAAKYGAASGNIVTASVAAFWRSAAAVTGIDLVSSGFIEIGSRISVYGLS